VTPFVETGKRVEMETPYQTIAKAMTYQEANCPNRCASLKSLHRSSLRLQTVVLFVAVCVNMVLLCGCSSGPTKEMYMDVPDGDFALYDASGKKFDQWNSRSWERASATKLTYKGRVFQPPLERQQMEKTIYALPIKNLLDKINDSHFYLTLLSDGRVLASSGCIEKMGHWEPISDLAIIDPKDKTLIRLDGLQVPRIDDAVVQLKDGRVIFIGGETTKEYADDGTDNLTNTVEELDLRTGVTKRIGRILVPRKGVMAEVIGDRDILIVGGWNQRTIARDEKWWPEAEIFRVPAKIRNR
jgi:hypothetical protein